MTLSDIQQLRRATTDVADPNTLAMLQRTLTQIIEAQGSPTVFEMVNTGSDTWGSIYSYSHQAPRVQIVGTAEVGDKRHAKAKEERKRTKTGTQNP